MTHAPDGAAPLLVTRRQADLIRRHQRRRFVGDSRITVAATDDVVSISFRGLLDPQIGGGAGGASIEWLTFNNITQDGLRVRVVHDDGSFEQCIIATFPPNAPVRDCVPDIVPHAGKIKIPVMRIKDFEWGTQRADLVCIWPFMVATCRPS